MAFSEARAGKGGRVPHRAKVVLTDYVWDSLEVEQKALEGLADLVALRAKTPDEFLDEAADCDALLNTYAGPITARVMERMPKCKIIARYGIGVDTIDVDAATAAGIIVTNNPTYCIEEVAEHTMALLLACARKVPFYDRMVRAGKWAVPPGKPIFRLAGQTLGPVGFGRSGQNVAARAAAFGMRILVYDPYLPGEGTDLQTLLRSSDFVSLHPPLTPQTRRLIGDADLRLMKPTAYLVNCARGPVIDTDALVRALDAGNIAGCALDTTDPEPLQDPHPLRGRETVTREPHRPWSRRETLRGLQAGAPSEVHRVLTGTWPVNVVNRAVKERNRAGL